jgi:hypothetical protein
VVPVVADSYVGRTPDGDPAYLAGALERAERGMPLRAVDLAELSYRVGPEHARSLATELDAYSAARRARERDRWSGIHQTRPLPFPPALARMLLRLRAAPPSQLLSGPELRRVAQRFGRRIGKAALRRAARTASRSTASRSRAAERRSTRSARARRGRR